MSRLSPSAGIATIEEGRVLTDTGAVIAPGDCLIAEVSSGFLGVNPWANEVFLKIKLPPVTRIDGSVAVLTTFMADNYFHWLFDTLPRLRLLQESGIPWQRIVVPRRTPFQREGLALLGLDDHRAIADGGLHLQASALVVPTLPGLSGNPPRWACDFLRETFLGQLGAARPQGRKIYISRRKSGTRLVLNEAALLETLQREGFELFFLEELSFLEQVRLFAGARIVVGAHGAGLSNLVFCPEGAGVIELFSPHYVNVCYWALSNQLNLQYQYVLGEPRRGKAGTEPPLVHENIELDIAKVQAALRAIGPAA